MLDELDGRERLTLAGTAVILLVVGFGAGTSIGGSVMASVTGVLAEIEVFLPTGRDLEEAIALAERVEVTATP